MENKSSSSLTGPLWVIAVGILILGIGACFTAYMLWDAKTAGQQAASQTSANSSDSPEMLRTNQGTSRPQLPPGATKLEVRPVPRVNNTPEVSASAPVPSEVVASATVVLPPPARASALPPLSGAAVTGLPAATISGRVRLVGTPPPEKRLPLDALCGKLHNPATPPTTRFYVVSPQGGLADVLVYLSDGTQGRSYPLPTTTPVIDQVGCEFIPYVLSLQTGQRMVVRNSDPLMHNNHFTPTVPGNGEVNRAQLPRGPDQSYTWPQPEIFLRLKCDVHPWMFAYLGVVEHPFHAVTDTNGVFQFAAPPPGRYVIEAVHRKTLQSGSQKLRQEINLSAGENLRIDFTVSMPTSR